MASSTLSAPTEQTVERYNQLQYQRDLEEFVEAPPCRNRSGRGALTGVLLGAGMWVAILAATGVIKL
jgi:fatty acid desaturase